MLNKSIFLTFNTNIRQDEKIHSYSGLKLADMPVAGAGPPSHQCSMCNATMWYNKRSKKGRKAVTLTFSLFCQDGRGPYTFRINGQNYHRIGSLLPAEGVPPRYTQQYFFETQNEIRNGMSAFMSKETPKTVDENIVANLIQMLDQTSAMAKSFRMAKEWYRSHGDANFGLRMLSERTTTRQYNAPTRQNQGTTLLRGGRLFQQYLIDSFTAIEEQRLNWTRNNQDMLCVDLYHNLCDVVTRGDASAAGLGKRIVLPQTYVGSPRYMMHNYQDTMDLCRTYGNLDLFITFTSNTKWPEIAEMLAYIPGQKSHDRPEVGTQVFKMKLIGLLEDLTKHHIFEKSYVVVYVIEFQKRGLPHAHILMWLKEEFKCRTPDQINDIISAELPCPTNDPDAYKVVSEFMLHGPCGTEAKHAPCTNEGKCSKHFPKKFFSETIINEDGYPIYRRRDNKITGVKGKFTYDNKHVVPHNRATIAIQENVKADANGASDQIMVVDEKNYLNYQFLSPCEAVWRLFLFDINYAYPAVMHPNYHLPDQNAITLRDSEHLPAPVERKGISITMFTEWFELNKKYPEAREYTYAEIPQHYRCSVFYRSEDGMQQSAEDRKNLSEKKKEEEKDLRWLSHRSSQVKIDHGGSLSSQIRASPSNEKGNSNNLIVVLGTSGCRNIDVTLLKNRRWLCGSCLPVGAWQLSGNCNDNTPVEGCKPVEGVEGCKPVEGVEGIEKRRVWKESKSLIYLFTRF
nr:hypothetical protein [Tanacetum cinerariifolium]